MIAVIEGTDHAGKTTFAHRLTEEFLRGPLLSDIEHRRVIRLHKGPSDTRPVLEQYEGDLLKVGPPEFLTDLRTLVILDRWHVGEALYGPLLRGQSRLSGNQLTHVEMLLSALGAQKHLVWATHTSLLRRHAAEPDELISAEQAIAIQDDYGHLCPPDWHRVDMSDDAVPDTRDYLGHLVTSSAFAAQLSEFTSYVGPLMPTCVLVGDRPGGVPPDWARAFTPLKYGSASKLIGGTLTPAGRWLNTGMVNQKGTNLMRLWIRLTCPHMIALGDVAAKAIADAGITDTSSAQHPQYVRRFHLDRWESYISNLNAMIDGE